MIRAAIISTDGLYRYQLGRLFVPFCTYDETVAFIGLNPSTADAQVDDATIRKCVSYAKAWGFKGLLMVNLFAYRATDPRVMRAAADPVGPDNDQHLVEVAAKAKLVVAAWGAHGGHLDRAAKVRHLLRERQLHTLHLTKDGHPGHPLYLRGDLKPQLWPR